MAQTYPSATDAAHASRSGKAISTETWTIDTPEGPRRAHIVMQPGRTPVYVYASCPSLSIRHAVPPSSDIDRIHQWEQY